MVSLDLAVCLGPVGPGLVHGGRGRGACSVPQSRAVTGPVVGDDPLDGNPDRLVPGGGAGLEPRSSGCLFVVEDLRVHDAGPVVDS